MPAADVIPDVRIEVEDPQIERRPFVPRRRVGRWAALGLAVTILAAFSGFYVIGKRTTPVTVGQVVDRYRSELSSRAVAKIVSPRSKSPVAPGQISPAGATKRIALAQHVAARLAQTVPAAGVYIYDTKGSEHVSALGGASHTYPSQTTVTVTKTPCGAELRWDALKERWLPRVADG